MENRDSVDGLEAVRPRWTAGPTMPPTMRALVQDRYGPPDVLRQAQVATPWTGRR